MSPFFASLRKALTIGGIQLCFPRNPLPLKVLLITPFILLGCAQQPSREQIAVWSYFLEQCKNEGIANTIDAMQGCITLKERQASNDTQFGNALQGMGAALSPEVYQGFVNTLGIQTCRIAPDYVGGYRTVCQGY